MIAAAQRWLGARSARERRLIVVAALVATGLGVGSAGLAVYEDLARLRARVAAHEHELAAVRSLAATVAGARPAGSDDGALMTRVQAATDAVRLGDRVAAMTPAGDPAAPRLAVRVSASLAETVHLLHALDDAGAPLGVARLGLRKHVDDPHRFDVTLEITGGGS